jgi:hypothetical protein
MCRAGIWAKNLPVMHAVTLSNNQRKPVFAIGFRIVPDEEAKSGKAIKLPN